MVFYALALLEHIDQTLIVMMILCNHCISFFETVSYDKKCDSFLS